MGKVTGFLDYAREENKDVPVEERIKNFKEFHIPLTEEERRKQGARCMNCGVPFCQSGMKLAGMFTGCPLHNLCPEWNDEVYNGHVAHALSRLLKTNNFPEFTGRVCPALCEKACVEGLDDAPVTTHDNELYIIEKAFQEGYMQPRIPEVRSGKRVAVVGAGPAGLAVADQLNHRGHSVTVFERSDEIGGLLMYGIPNMKLDKSVIRRRRALMEAEGVVFRTGVDVGRETSTAAAILRDYDAVVLACGAKQARGLNVPSIEQAHGIHYAVDYLTSQTKALHEQGEHAFGIINAKGKHVVIVGGGDTGNDCCGTAIRQGAKSVTQIEMMPEPPVERAASNPWPEWPKVLKVDYGQQEAIRVFGHDPRVYETTIKAIETKKDGSIKAVITSKVKFENRQMVLVEGTEQKLPCDLLIIAAGFTGCESYVADAFGVALTESHVVKTEAEHYHTESALKAGASAQTTAGSEDGEKSGVASTTAGNSDGEKSSAASTAAGSTAKAGASTVTAADTAKIFTAGDMHRGQSLVVWAIAEGRACASEVDAYLMGYSCLA
ncbi:MAG: glutamate synthase subunit beta [Oribacterium sp.]|nr:glutamate synthase subunit beta [Oribacterium sp.]